MILPKRTKEGIKVFNELQMKNCKIGWIAMNHHVTHKGLTLDFDTHRYLLPIYYDTAPYMVIMKSTQCGLTEYLIVRALGKAIKGMSIFYVLPTYDLVGRFVRNRIDKSITNTPYYKGLERIARLLDPKIAESMKLKDIGTGSIAFVGSNSTAGFTEYPADEVIIDELDECDQDNIEMAWERMSHSEIRTQIKIANPTLEGKGIDKEFSKTDKREWAVECNCGKHIILDWFKHVVRQEDENVYVIRDKDWDRYSGKDINVICDLCGRPINRKGYGRWEPQAESDRRGYHISKLFSGTTLITELLERFEGGLVNDKKMERFYNADLGLGYSAEGAKITRKMIIDCIGDYNKGKPETGMVIAGIDVGAFYHYVIKRLLPDGRLKTLEVGAIRSTEEMILKLKEYKARVGIIDGLPETRESRKIAGHFKYFFLCYYGAGKSDVINAKAKTVTVDRTSALDAVKESLLTNKIIYPKNIESDDEFINHMTASTRVYDPDKRKAGDRGVYEWQEGSKPDHYFHATAYCLIARRLLVMLANR